MTDATGEAIRAIVERALSDLVAAGLDPEDAPTLLAVQGIVRAQKLEDLQAFVRLARESIEALLDERSLH